MWNEICAYAKKICIIIIHDSVNNQSAIIDAHQKIDSKKQFYRFFIKAYS